MHVFRHFPEEIIIPPAKEKSKCLWEEPAVENLQRAIGIQNRSRRRLKQHPIFCRPLRDLLSIVVLQRRLAQSACRVPALEALCAYDVLVLVTEIVGIIRNCKKPFADRTLFRHQHEASSIPKVYLSYCRPVFRESANFYVKLRPFHHTWHAWKEYGFLSPDSVFFLRLRKQPVENIKHPLNL